MIDFTDFSDLFPTLKKRPWGDEKQKLIIANRPPLNTTVTAQWWYDRKEKVMYRATDKGYVKD